MKNTARKKSSRKYIYQGGNIKDFIKRDPNLNVSFDLSVKEEKPLD